MSNFDKMGITNRFWGICGFNSSLYALYKNNTQMRVRLAEGADSPTRMLAEIKTFLRMLQADGKTGVLDAIEAFTQSFEGYDDFTIESYINRINAVVTSNVDITQDSKFSMAVHPEGVVEYLKTVCNFRNAAATATSSIGGSGECVLGLHKGTGGGPYGGLKHYVYYLGGTYYSWGLRFSSLNQMKMGYKGICQKITF